LNHIRRFLGFLFIFLWISCYILRYVCILKPTFHNVVELTFYAFSLYNVRDILFFYVRYLIMLYTVEFKLYFITFRIIKRILWLPEHLYYYLFVSVLRITKFLYFWRYGFFNILKRTFLVTYFMPQILSS